jgi:membrane protein YqaA with SNARE-associated domain
MRLDHFVRGNAAMAASFAWGFAEATFFFLVPEVLLTMLACRGLRPALKAALSALAGALTGGALMHLISTNSPWAATSFLDHIPGISPSLIGTVGSQIDQHGIIAVMLGPISGIPYKIYAVEWGARGGNLVAFLLISIPARYIRFALACVATRGLVRLIEPWTRHYARIEILLLALFWIAFYGFYFSRFGW